MYGCHIRHLVQLTNIPDTPEIKLLKVLHTFSITSTTHKRVFHYNFELDISQKVEMERR